jgi:hypothetical protein
MNFDNYDIRKLICKQAKVHLKQNCFGLPRCASCRASALVNRDFNVLVAEDFIKNQLEGTKCYMFEDYDLTKKIVK